MKNLFYLIFLSFCLTVSTSCKKNTDAPAPGNKGTVSMENKLNKKWSTSTATSRTTTDPVASDFVSFEFNSSGNYYIVKADKSLFSGTYTLNTADSIVTLYNGSSTTSQYGTLSISEITATTLVFKLELAATPTPINISTTAVTTSVGTSSTTSTSATAQLAKAWKVDKYTQGGNTYTITGTSVYAHVVLTENGTYWTETYNGTGTTTTQYGQWKWSDNTYTKICTSSTDAAPDCTTSGGTVSFDTNGNLIMTSTPPGQLTLTYYYSLLNL